MRFLLLQTPVFVVAGQDFSSALGRDDGGGKLSVCCLQLPSFRLKVVWLYVARRLRKSNLETMT